MILSQFKLYLIRSVLLIIVGMTVSVVQAETVIKVGGYEFPPFVYSKNMERAHGATIDMIASLNQVQDEYHFEYFPTSSKRRYMDFAAGRYDLIMFENIEWGWQEQAVEQSKVFMKGGEVYIAYNRPDRDQHFFDDMANRRMVGILGYHYGFTDFNADENYLAEHFNVLLSTDHLRSIRLILADRPELAEIAVVTRSFLRQYLIDNPEHEKQLLISDKFDQVYQHRILVRDNASITVDKVNQLIKKLEVEGVLDTVRARYGLDGI
ncbi:substrate-binding periplasmic protein [Alkalimarinus sediminis]|uniref:Transporter substrate-binding domain-containing protein n=1 Tax=Alkalimarinus sediminis TaxID=1632866 RepID=A0A9E8HI47_9ALTE|nr:transporter substrate-binding domain-containing protein [Alkalimarinus sediminis]UZW75103.1 transporter substrate-binding domain-containing protein [Alkalimarinus sediminis]